MLDASKAFDRVNYCKLFATLLKRNISSIVLRLLLFMYTHQSLRVKWGSTLSKQFSVMNGVKHLAGRSTVTDFICCVYRWFVRAVEKYRSWLSHG